MAVGDVIYVGTDDARMLRLSKDAKLEPLGRKNVNRSKKTPTAVLNNFQRASRVDIG